MHQGSCLCGKVEIAVTGKPINSRYCHCRLCQKVMASPSFARVLFNQSDVKILGPVTSYSSSKRLDRIFCPNCGSSIAARRKNGTVTGLALALFDESEAFPPTEHIWVSEKLDWVILDDGLIQHLKGAPNIKSE